MKNNLSNEKYKPKQVKYTFKFPKIRIWLNVCKQIKLGLVNHFA